MLIIYIVDLYISFLCMHQPTEKTSIKYEDQGCYIENMAIQVSIYKNDLLNFVQEKFTCTDNFDVFSTSSLSDKHH